MARKRAQAKRGGTAKSKTAASRSKTKTAASRSTAKKTTSRSKTKSTGRSKTTSSRSKTTSSRSKTASSASKKTGAARRGARRAPARQPRTPALALGSLDDVLKEQLGDLYSAEKQLVQALPKVARAATHPGLRGALEDHLEETKEHVRRLERIFSGRGMSTPTKKCKAMAGLIEEGDEIVNASGDPAAKDAALIAAAQRVEHYEIAAYGTARTLAGELDLDEAKGLLQETLSEEGKADELLTRLATGGLRRTGINEQAAE